MSAWTDMEIERLRDAYRARESGGVGLRLDELAAALGRHKSNVCRKARGLGLTRKDAKKGGRAPEQRTLFATSGFRSSQQANVIRKHGHPRGARGMKVTDAMKAAMLAGTRKMWADPTHPINSPEHRQRKSDRLVARSIAGSINTSSNTYSRCARGKRADIGDTFFRSAWEANYARYLNTLIGSGTIARWEYEVHTFEFTTRCGVRTYKPDFKVTMPDGRHEWHEVKGWMDETSRARLDLMAVEFPAETIVLRDEEWFRTANKTIGHEIAGWERKRGSRTRIERRT